MFILKPDTGENPKWNSTEPYYDSLYCNVRLFVYGLPLPGEPRTEDIPFKKWDTYRTLYPLMSLHDPVTFSRIVRGMIDIQKHEGLFCIVDILNDIYNFEDTGWLPECRGATVQQFIQGGTSMFQRETYSGLPGYEMTLYFCNRWGSDLGRILRQVRLNCMQVCLMLNEMLSRFNKQAAALNVSATDLYAALLADAEIQSPNWNLQGRQADIWKALGTYLFCIKLLPFLMIVTGYIPQDMFDAGGANTKQVSRTLEVCTCKPLSYQHTL